MTLGVIRFFDTKFMGNKKKSLAIKGISMMIIVLLTSCNSKQYHKHQINGNEEYLTAPLLHKLKTPSGITLPMESDDYKISAIVSNAAVGKKLDVSPPHVY